MLTDERIEALLEKYVKQDSVVSFGTGPTNEDFLKKLALYSTNSGVRIKVVPTSLNGTTIPTKNTSSFT